MATCAKILSPRVGSRTGRVRLSGIVKQSIVDGPGLRLVVFAQGCPHHCPGCQNPATHAFDGGADYAIADILADFDRNPLLAGVTLSGGEPFARADELLPLARRIRDRGKNVWCYTGYTFEELLDRSDRDAAVGALLEHIDVLVDGRFELSRKSLSLRFRGSENQRLLDLPRSLRLGVAVSA